MSGSIRNSAADHYPGKPITETLTNGFFTVDKKWTVTYWNNAAEKLLGASSKDIMGKNLWKEFAGIIPLEFYNVYQKAFVPGIPLHFEEYWGEMGAWFDVVTYHCDDTLSVSFKSSNHPHSEYPENPVKQLKTLTELYKFVTEITNDCLWEWDLRVGEIFWIDGGHKRALGYQVENALIPQSFWENCIHPDDRARVLSGLNKVFTAAAESFWQDEYRFKKVDGTYAYVQDRGHIIYEEGKACRMIGATQDITEKILLQNKLAEQRQLAQREITGAVITALENERQEIGKELHDNLCQVLAMTKMYLEMARKSEKNRMLYIDASRDYVIDVIEEIRKISKNLIIPDLRIYGLFDNIKNLLDDLAMIKSTKFQFNVSGIDENEMDEKLQLNIFRIVQEQVNNILKHADAANADISLYKHHEEIILLISDNGKGCDTTKKADGIGILNIISRSELYQGHVTFLSEPGEGCTLKVTLRPVKKQ